MKKIILGAIAILVFVPSIASAAFDTNLRYGSKGKDVKELQEFLADQGLYSGPISGNFFTLTLKAVKAFQKAQNIKPVSGYFGPATRKIVNNLLDQELAQSNLESVNDTPIAQPKTSETVAIKKDEQTYVAPQSATSAIDFCKNIPQNQTTIPLGMYRSSDGDCFVVPMTTPTVTNQTKPTITKLVSIPEKARVGQTVKISYKAENAKVCALSNIANISVPFAGNLPEGDLNEQMQQRDFKDNKFTLYLICADKDWAIVSQTLTISYDPVFDSIQPTSFFSASGENIGNGGTGSLNGVPFVQIVPLKIGANATVDMDGKVYQLDPDGVHFFFKDLSFNPTWIYAGSCTPHTYTINFSFSDQYNSNITGVAANGGFCLNNLVQP